MYPKLNKPHVRIRWRSGRAQVTSAFYDPKVDPKVLGNNLSKLADWLLRKGFVTVDEFQSHMHEGVIVSNLIIPAGSPASKELVAKQRAQRQQQQGA